MELQHINWICKSINYINLFVIIINYYDILYQHSTYTIIKKL